MKRLIPLQTAFVVLFLIFGIPSVLSADSKNIWQDNSCITELIIRSRPEAENKFLKEYIQKEGRSFYQGWRQHVSRVFVGEVVWAQPRKDAEHIGCGLGIGSRNVRHRVKEVLLGDLQAGSEVMVGHEWCELYPEIYHLGAKFIIGLNTRFYKNFPEQAPPNGMFAWELPFSPQNREIAKTFIQCIQDRGIVKAMEKENK